MAEYKVSIANPLSLPADQRVRAGITVTKQDGYVGELTDEHLDAIKADEHLVVEATKPARSEEPSTDWKLDELKTYATEHGVEGAEGFKKKQDALDAIVAAVKPADQ